MNEPSLILVIALRCYFQPSNDRSTLTSLETYQTFSRPSSSVLPAQAISLALHPTRPIFALLMAVLLQISSPSPHPDSRTLPPLQKCRLVSLRLQSIRYQQSLPLQRSHGL